MSRRPGRSARAFGPDGLFGHPALQLGVVATGLPATVVSGPLQTFWLAGLGVVGFALTRPGRPADDA